jgi:hypothetical protein
MPSVPSISNSGSLDGKVIGSGCVHRNWNELGDLVIE